MRRRLLCLPPLAVAAVAAAGCGVTNPYDHPAARTTTTASATSTVTASTPRVALPSAPAEAQNTRAILARYARLATNWTSRTLARDQHQLARLAVGAARAQALQTAATYGHGSTLQHSKVTNHGQITSIARGTGPRRGQWVITTQETTGGQGDYTELPAQAHVYIADVTHTRRGWRVSTWSPQN